MVYLAVKVVEAPTAVLVLAMDKTICPGMSNKYHGSQGNNYHPLYLCSRILFSVTGCIFINTDTSMMANFKGSSKNVGDVNLYKKVAMTIGGATRLVSRVAGTKAQVQSGKKTLTRFDTTLQVLNAATPLPPNNKRRKRVSLLYHLVSTNNRTSTNISSHVSF